VGGDLVKALFIAHQQPGKRPEAIATVLVDRILGLYAMLLVACLGLGVAGNQIESAPLLRSLQFSVGSVTLAGTAGLLLACSAATTGPTAQRLAERLPLVGPLLARLMEAANVYRSRKAYLIAGFAIALVTHGLLITAFWLISQGLPVRGPSLLQTAALVPIGLVAGALLPTPGGLGGLEGTLEWLYSSIGAGQGDGTLVALAYRMMAYLVAAVGACYYFSARKQVQELMHEAEALAETETYT
jgi:uncharacterized membrane protein YbhN (UPF0104 family)